MNLGKTVNALKNKVLETVQTTSKPKFISEDENFNLLYEKYSRLGIFENQLNNLVRDSVSSIQKSTQANKELSVFLQMTMEGQLRDCFDISSITEKFCNLQNSIASAQFNDFMNNTQQQFLKPVMRDKELDQQLQVHLEGRVIDERLVEMLTLRAEERTITLSQVILAVMETQYNYYTTIATLYADLHGELGPIMAKMAGRKAGNAKPTSPPPHHQQPPAKPPTQSNVPPATQSAPQNGARARGNSSTPPPTHTRPQEPPQQPPKPEPPTVTTNIFVDDFLTAPSATKATSREAIFSFDDTPTTHAPPLNPTNNSNTDFFSMNSNTKNSYFDDFETLAPQKMNGNSTQKSNNSNGFDPFGGFSGGYSGNNSGNGSYSGNNNMNGNSKPSSSGLDDLNWGTSSAPPKSASPVPNSSALQDKLDRDRHQQQEQDARRHFDVLVSEKVDAWANNKKGNLRALLANLHQIIYEDSGWTEAPLSELVQPGALKKVYRKAMLVVHPDKTAGKSLETRLLAERLFATLQEAAKTAQWN